jgi:hypothetical protein
MLPGQSSQTDYEKQARAEFARAAYKDAAATLRLAIYKGNKTASIWLLLGESYEKDGEIGSARQAYQTITQYFPGSRECQLAGQHLALLPNSAASHAATERPSGKHLIDRITKVAPRFGHPEISPVTIGRVRDIVAHLPKTIYKILDRGKVSIFVTPNLIDRFPDGVNFRFGHDGSYLGQQFGRTYDRDIYVCERCVTAGGSTTLGPVNDMENIVCTTYTQLGHALDDCLEQPSRDEQFLQLYRQDCASADPAKYPMIKNYLKEEASGPGEVFGGLAALLMGDNGSLSQALSHSFPRSRAWIEKRLQVLSEERQK